MAPSFNVAILLYPTADILDFSGPIEIYSSTRPMGEVFKTTTFARETSLQAGIGGLTLTPDKSFAEVEASLSNYDILVIPGADPVRIKEMIDEDGGKAYISLIRKFTALAPRQETGHRIIQSVCTGALFLAAAGVLQNRTATTHHISYDLIKEVADEAAGGDSNINVVRKRWVDAGMTDAGVRIVNAGGVTSGIDTSLYLVELLVGSSKAESVADLVEFVRRGQDDAWVQSQ
jgi:transcriptional regulator GlxA family with amidase domain